MSPNPSKIKIIIPYFGRWPEWFVLFLQSCRYNPDIDWLFFTDCDLSSKVFSQVPNIEFVPISFSDYKAMVSERLAIDFHQADPYKLCDLKPCYGYLHQDYLGDDYDFFGFGDIDLIYGNLRQFLTPDILSRYQLIATHNNRISGHLCLLKNHSVMRSAFMQIPNWRTNLQNPQHLGIDESQFTKVFIPHRKHPQWLKKLYGGFNALWRNNYFKEQYSTILSPIPWHQGKIEHPQNWYWEQGKLTNADDGEREFMYLHFMNWKSSKWLDKRYGEKAAWEDLSTLVHFDTKLSLEQLPKKWCVNKQGFFD